MTNPIDEINEYFSEKENGVCHFDGKRRELQAMRVMVDVLDYYADPKRYEYGNDFSQDYEAKEALKIVAHILKGEA